MASERKLHRVYWQHAKPEVDDGRSIAEGIQDITDTTPYEPIPQNVVVQVVASPPWERCCG